MAGIDHQDLAEPATEEGRDPRQERWAALHYTPLLTREQWLSSESEGLLDRLFGGRVAPLVAHFSKHQKLTKKDIADLKVLIRELGDD